MGVDLYVGVRRSRVPKHFPDREQWAYAYYGTNYDRLVRVRKRYDLDDFFHFQQSLPSHHVPGRGAPTT